MKAILQGQKVSGLPSGGTAGQVLTKTETGSNWQDSMKELPEDGSTGQILEKTATGTQWADKPSGGIPIVTTSGTGSVYTATVPGITELTPGTMLVIVPHVNSSARAKLNVNGLGAKDLECISYGAVGGSFSGVEANSIVAGTPVLLMLGYDDNVVFDSYWQVISQPIVHNDRIVVKTTFPKYTENQVRGIALQTSTPSSIPNGSIVGVYST